MRLEHMRSAARWLVYDGVAGEGTGAEVAFVREMERAARTRF